LIINDFHDYSASVILLMPYSRGKFTANESQSKAICHPPAPLMIIAGAGTGKTTTLLHRIIYLLEHYGFAPENLLAITYTEKAAEELKDRIVTEVGAKADSLVVGTFHAFCYAVVKEFGFSPDAQPSLIDEGDAIYLLLDRFDELGPFESREFPLDPIKAVTGSMLPFINKMRDQLIDPNEITKPVLENDEQTGQLNDLLRIYGLFSDWKKSTGLVDYGDMIQQCWDLMQNPQILATLRSRHKHLIIDEFQDNNFALNEILGRLAEKSGSITVVGDDDQVIYSFRGASAYNISDFKKRYSQYPQYAEIALAENYRSTQAILDVANAVIANNPDRQPKILTNPSGKSGNQPIVYYGSTITQNSNLPQIVNKYLNNGYHHGDIAILCRTRNQAREAAAQLQKFHQPVSIFLTEYFQLPIIKDILAWCEVVADGAQIDSALFRILKTTIGTTATHTWYSSKSRRDYSSRYELLKTDLDSGKIDRYPQLVKIIKLIEELRHQTRVMKKTAGEMVWEICAVTGILRPYARRYEYIDRIALSNAGELINRSQEFSRRFFPNNSLKRFLSYIDTLAQANSIPAVEPNVNRRQSAVTVMTVHRAKGLEFPVVIIPYNQSQRFPLNYRGNKLLDAPPTEWSPIPLASSGDPRDQHRREERRLFYVALTRARDQLVLLAPEKRTSPFIKEIPTKLIRRITMEADQNSQSDHNAHEDIRVEYEQRLNSAVSAGQFQIAGDLLKALDRIAQFSRNAKIDWGTTEWELDLRAKLSPEVVPKIPDRLTLSASAIETYSSCPFKYRLGYIDKVPETASKPQLTFGSIIHQVLEHFHKENYQTEQDLLDLLERFWRSEGFDYESRETSFKDQGKEILHNYFQFIQANPPTVLATEYIFTFDLDSCSIRGMIDRIDAVDGGINVIDYKTSKTPTNANKSLQLAVYCMFLTQQPEQVPGGLPKAASLLFLREENEPKRSHSFTSDELSVFREKIDLVVAGITNRDFDCKTGRHCDWCDYKQLLCPAWESN